MYFEYNRFPIYYFPNERSTMSTGKTLSPIIDDGYTLDGFIKGDGKTYPSMKFQYRPSLAHERLVVRRLMNFHLTDTETESLLANRTAIQLALAAAKELTEQAMFKLQIAGLTKLVQESQERFLDTILTRSAMSEREAAKWVATKVANWGYDIEINEDNIFRLHPILGGALFNIIIGNRDSDDPTDEGFDESKAVGN